MWLKWHDKDNDHNYFLPYSDKFIIPFELSELNRSEPCTIYEKATNDFKHLPGGKKNSGFLLFFSFIV